MEARCGGRGLPVLDLRRLFWSDQCWLGRDGGPEHAVRSNNWAGYYALASSPNAFTDISSTWVIPGVQAPSSGTAYNADWIGFDGATGSADPTVEQCGTLTEITSGGSATYLAWYEFYPAGAEEVNLTVHPGDTMNAEITYEASQSSTGNYAYYIDLSDLQGKKN